MRVMYKKLDHCPNVRLPEDTILPQFVYKHLTDNLLNLAQKNLPMAFTKKILKEALGATALAHSMIMMLYILVTVAFSPQILWTVANRI